ncbi:MAG: hypothetical protein JNK05_16905 [Myxococcales bacterium]|nr:hypothetical protein [Myxococcales bacterium]
MKSTLEIASLLLDSAHSPAGDRARGTFAGVPVELRFVDRGVGSYTDLYTEIVVLGAGVRRDLHLAVVPRREKHAGYVNEGLATHVRLGDAAFDDAFLVEAAPADVVRALMDEDARRAMLSHGRVGLHTTTDGLMIEREAWMDEPDEIRPLIALAVRIAANVDGAFLAADRAQAERAGYRTGPIADLDAARRQEVAVVKERQSEREDREQTRSLFAVFAIFAVLALIASAVAAMRR